MFLLFHHLNVLVGTGSDHLDEDLKTKIAFSFRVAHEDWVAVDCGGEDVGGLQKTP